jgi:LacI family transcriptional regulator
MPAQKQIDILIQAKKLLEPGEKPTLKTLSRLSGMAVATVSRALSDAPDISDATKKKVRQIADEVGYVPNRAGVRLRTGRTNVIALVLAAESDILNHTATLIASISEELQSTQFHLIVKPHLPGEDPLRAISYFVETGSADGIIINQTTAEDPRVAYMLKKGFPFVTHGRTNWPDQHPFFDYDNEKLAQQVLQHLYDRGRRRILLVLPPQDQLYSQHLSKGATDTAHKLGLELRFNEGVTSNSSITEQREYLTVKLRADPAIDAIFGSSAASAMAGSGAAEARGLTVGKDIDILGKETIPFLKEFRPGIISAREDVSRAGQFLTRAVIQAIRYPEKQPMQGIDIPSSDLF